MFLLRLLAIFLCFNQSVFAYLDPSTGSLLLSSLVAIFASIIFFIKSVFYKILNFIDLLRGGGSKTSLRGKNTYSIVFYSEGRSYYNVFAPILNTLDKWNIDYIFLTSDAEDPAFHFHKQKVRFIGQKAYLFLNSLKADIVIMTTPGLDVLEIKRAKGVSHYCHIVHSLGSPNYRVFGMDYYDSILCNALMQKEFVEKVTKAHHLEAKEIKIIGSTYCDVLHSLKEKSIIEKPFFDPKEREKNKVVLLSPSWGKEGALARYGMELISKIIDAGFLLIIRPHPQSLIAEKKMIINLQSQTKNKKIIWDIGTTNINAMQESDLMISDFSGIIFDYLCLYEKPVLTLDFVFDHSGYDSADIGGMWEFDIFHKIGGRIQDFSNLKTLIEEACKNKNFTQEIQKIKSLLWTYPGMSGILGAIAILEIKKRILEKKIAPYQEICDDLFKIKNILNLQGGNHE